VELKSRTGPEEIPAFLFCAGKMLENIWQIRGKSLAKTWQNVG
jgi:hypothetical protein